MTAAMIRPIAPAGSVGQPIIARKGIMKTRDSRKLAMISNISKITGFSPANFIIYSSPFLVTSQYLFMILSYIPINIIILLCMSLICLPCMACGSYTLSPVYAILCQLIPFGRIGSSIMCSSQWELTAQ